MIVEGHWRKKRLAFYFQLWQGESGCEAMWRPSAPVTGPELRAPLILQPASGKNLPIALSAQKLQPLRLSVGIYVKRPLTSSHAQRPPVHACVPEGLSPHQRSDSHCKPKHKPTCGLAGPHWPAGPSCKPSAYPTCSPPAVWKVPTRSAQLLYIQVTSCRSSSPCLHSWELVAFDLSRECRLVQLCLN